MYVGDEFGLDFFVYGEEGVFVGRSGHDVGCFGGGAALAEVVDMMSGGKMYLLYHKFLMLMVIGFGLSGKYHKILAGATHL